MEAPFLLTVTDFGHIGVNAGIDRSNVPDSDLLLLPERPSESAERLRERLPVDRVVVTDTSGRPFRHGQRGAATGWARTPASRPRRRRCPRTTRHRRSRRANPPAGSRWGGGSPGRSTSPATPS